MKRITQILIKSCEKLNLKYRSLHKTNNLFLVHTKSQDLIFGHTITPFNSESEGLICRDKDFTYSLFAEYLKFPKTISFCNPDIDDQYQEYVEYKDTKEITKKILEEFSLPVIIKKNSGSQGMNVFKCNTKKEILTALKTIYNQKSKDYDYISLAQEYIEIQKEFRVIWFKGDILLIYEKDNSKGEFVGNLSPFHWNNSKAVIIDDKILKKRVKEFLSPINNIRGFNYLGVDICLDKEDNMFLLELNSHPGFSKFLLDNDESYLVDMFVKILSNYIKI